MFNTDQSLLFDISLFRVEFSSDTKVSNAATFIINCEDHTLGNTLRMQLLADENVIFAGYKLPHPLESRIIVSIRTNDNSTPIDAFHQALQRLEKISADLHSQMVNAIEHFRREQESTFVAD